ILAAPLQSWIFLQSTITSIIFSSGLFFSTQAAEQANFNRQFATGLHDKQFSGKFKVYPERHPARKSGLEDAPVIMVSFHPETPGSLLPPMGFMTTLCGQMLSQTPSSSGYNCQLPKKKSGQQEFIEKEMVTDWHAIVPFGLEIPASIFVVSARRLSVFFKSEGVHGVWELSGPSDEVTMLSGFTMCKAGISKLLRSGIMLTKKARKPSHGFAMPSQAKMLARVWLWLWLQISEAKAKPASQGLGPMVFKPCFSYIPLQFLNAQMMGW
ncbi:hypothetical protein B0H10DRAFT_1974174, partial [Mycena sp. CBHHK59/15]